MRLRIIATLAASLVTTAHGASYVPLGPNVTPKALSADGSVVVGVGSGSWGSGAFRWTAASGFVALDTPPGGTNATANAVSADGGVVVGTFTNTLGVQEAFRWTAQSGMVGLGDLTGEGYHSTANAVSADGGVIVGSSFNPYEPGPNYITSATRDEVFRWTAADGMVGIGVPGIYGSSWANAVSADGNVIVGLFNDSFDWGDKGYYWSAEGGWINFGDTVWPLALSADGSTVVGLAHCNYPSCPTQSFRWIVGQGIVPIPNIDPYHLTEAYGVSADGAVVVGLSKCDQRPFFFNPYCDHPPEAMVWTESAGTQRLLDVLLAGGASGLDGVNLSVATAISANGQWIVGNGSEGVFLANLAPVPIPAAAWLFGGALGGLGVLKRRQKNA